MAITWGSWQNTSSNGMRVGYDVSRTSVSSSSSSVKFTVKIYTQNKYPFSDAQHIDYGSYLGSRTSFTNSSGSGSVLRATKTYTYSYSDYGVSRNLSSYAQVGGVWSGLTPRVTIRLSVPARPFRAPLAPTGLYISSQNTSGALWLNWNNRANSSTGRPYTSQRIEYSYVNSSGSWTGWQFLATASAGASSYRYTNLYSNTRYQFRVRANNKAGSSGWSGTVATNTVPAAPTGARARVQATGDAISFTWTRNNRRDDGVVFHQVQRQTSTTGAWSTVASKLSGTATSWIDATPNAGYNRYRVRAYLDNEHLTQYSGYSTAAAITTIVPPLAPAQLRMDPRTPDFTTGATLSWQHRDGGDGSEQSYYQIGYRDAALAGAWTYTDEVSSTVESYTFEADELANGVDWEIRVRTRGNTKEGFGPYSASLIVAGWTAPTVNFIDEAPPEVVNQIPFNVEWFYNQDEGLAQLRATVEIWTTTPNDEGTPQQDSRVFAAPVQGDATALAITNLLEDGATYLVRVRVESSREQVSEWSERFITVDLLPPARAALRPQYDSDTGVMVLEVEPYAPRYGVEVGRNLHTNPQGNAVTYSRGTNGVYDTTYLTDQNDGPLPEITAYVRTTANTPAPSGSGGWNGHTGEQPQRVDAPAGSWVAMSFYVRYNGNRESTYYRPRIYLKDDNNANITTYDGVGNVYHYAGEWTKVTNVIQAVDGAAKVGFWHYFIGGDNLDAGDSVDFGGIHFAVGPTEAAALDAVAEYYDGSFAATATHGFSYAGEAGNSPSVKYELFEHVEGDDAAPFESGIATFDVQRSIDDGEWVTILAGVDATTVDDGDTDEGDTGAKVISLMDLLPAISGTNRYRLVLYSFSPSVGDTTPVAVRVTPALNEGWAFLNYGANMGNVLRVGNNVTARESVSVSGEDVFLQGRKRPVSLFGEHESRSVQVNGSLYHDELQAAPSSQSPLDSPPEDWRRAAREANTVCLRTPAGHRIYGRLSGVDLDSTNLNVTSLSFSVVENDFTENETSGAGVEVI